MHVTVILVRFLKLSKSLAKVFVADDKVRHYANNRRKNPRMIRHVVPLTRG